ncbi:MAG TPA: HEPN domain-containing protein [Chitinivibrionales bacterium]|nr:HEPN domain-containing protein [Chitinivibrionales bacterium]
MKEKTRPWIEFAGRDLAAAEKLQADDTISSIVLYHRQQCIEKSIKALFEEHDLHVPRIHATLKLHSDIRQAVPSMPQFADNEDLEFIDNTYIDAGYPVGMGTLPVGLPSLKETSRGLVIARRFLIRSTLF